MRDILMFCIIFGLVPLMLKRPAIGALVFMWMSIMNPHRLAYGPAYDFPFAAMIAMVTLVGALFTKEPRRYPLTPVTALLIVLALWTTLTSFFGLMPDIVWIEWNRVMKTLFMVCLTIMLVNTEKDLKKLMWILGLSLGFYGFKGGLFTIASGGSYRVWGPDGSYIYENNSLALALIMAVPIIWYLRLQAEQRWLKHSLEAVAVLSVISAAGSYSRGAAIGGVAMMGLLWLKSRNKLGTGLVLLLTIPIVLLIMPEQWTERMTSISNYQTDESALGRINAWYFAIEVAKQHIFGGGFLAFHPHTFITYAPIPWDFHAAHSIYFQVLGEHGYVGLGLYLALIVATWRMASRTIKACRNHTELKWASDLAAMCQVSLVGYLVGGAFLSLAYYDYLYYIIAALVITEKILVDKKVFSRGRAPIARPTPSKDRPVIAKPENMHAR
ncbi:MAG: putative O-glycosylation ligase, exosortase A system-associated [Pseudomonadota bacterium]